MKLTHLSLALLALTVAQGAQAQVSASAVIDWSSLSVTYIDTTPADLTDQPLLTFFNPYTDVDAYAVSPYAAVPASFPGMLSALDWTTVLNQPAATTYANGTGAATPVSLVALAGAMPSVAGFGFDYNSGSGLALRGADFSMTGVGLAAIQVNYSLGVNDLTPLDFLDFAGANVSFSGNYTNCCGQPISTYLSDSVDSGIDTVLNKTGTFYMAVVNDSILNTVNGSIYADASSYAMGYVDPVPEPETWAMMIAGLGLLGLMGRRRSA